MGLETLSPTNTELIDRLFSLSNRCAIGDSSAMLELIAAFHEDAELASMLDVVPPADGSVEDVIRSYFEQIRSSCFVWYVYADELRDQGECVLALGGIRTVNKETRDDRETAVGWVFTMREGKVGAIKAYSSYVDAVASARNS